MSSVRRLRLMLGAGATFVGVAGTIGCSLITSYDGFTGALSVTDASDATMMTMTVDAATPVDAGDLLCAPNIPPKPTLSDPTPPPTKYFGVTTALRFVPLAGGCPVLGKNLDEVDSCNDGGGQSCVPVGMSDAGVCDSTGGVDDNGRGVLEGNLLNPNAFSNLAELVTDQYAGFAISLSSYGGDADDPQVSVAFLPVAGTSNGATVLDDFYFEMSLARLVASEAYVTGGVLVAHFTNPDLPLPLQLAAQATSDAGFAYSTDGGPNWPVILPLTDAYLIGRPIVEGDGGLVGGLTMNDAQLVGRITEGNLLEILSEGGLCIAGNPMYSALLCGDFDLPSVSPSDPSSPCTALSTATGFDLRATTIASPNGNALLPAMNGGLCLNPAEVPFYPVDAAAIYCPAPP